MFLEIHVIHPLSSHPNRGRNGAPKAIPWGGQLRSRVSSQCWKRAMRMSVAQTMDTGVRTRHILDLAMKAWRQGTERVGNPEAVSELLTEIISSALSEIGDNGLTANTLYLGYGEIERVVALVDEALNNLEIDDELGSVDDLDPDILVEMCEEEGLIKDVAKNWRSWIAVSPVPVDIALFGRMVAADPEAWNVEAATSVAHAVATHRLQNEVDYFSAMDDVEGRASFLGTRDIQTAVFYRNLVLDVDQLSHNLGHKPVVVAGAVRVFLNALAAVPEGGMSNGSHYNRPELVVVTARRTQPLNALSAFDPPVRADQDGLVAASIKRLEHHVLIQDAAWGNGNLDMSRYVLAPTAQGVLSGLDECRLPSIQAIADQVTFDLNLDSE